MTAGSPGLGAWTSRVTLTRQEAEEQTQGAEVEAMREDNFKVSSTKWMTTGARCGTQDLSLVFLTYTTLEDINVFNITGSERTESL